MFKAYEPREDSLLLLEEAKKHAEGKVLEIGTGTGLIAIAAAKSNKVKSVTATDINPIAIETAKENAKKERAKIKLIKSDLFENVQGKFDTIIFNPPYLPHDKGIEDGAIYGGKKGYETIERFLNESSKFLAKDGKILLLFSSLTKKEKVEEIISNNCLEFEKLSEKNIFFEKLYVYKIEKSKLLKELEAKRMFNVKKLAKGHRGIVYTGNMKGEKIAIKTERKDSKALGRIKNEARWIKKLNKERIGPKFIFENEKYFAYKFVEGKLIEEFVRSANKKEIKNILNSILKQCFEMDNLGVNKEEMHHPVKHIIISKGKPVMIDFERCRRTEKPKNVTQFLQFISTRQFNSLLKEKGIDITAEEARTMAREYSQKGMSLKFLLKALISNNDI